MQVIRTSGPVLIFGGPYSNLEATQALIDEAPGPFPAFADITLEGGTDLEVSEGAVVIFGELAAATLDFQIRAIGLTASMERRVQAIQWDPTVHADKFVAP